MLSHTGDRGQAKPFKPHVDQSPDVGQCRPRERTLREGGRSLQFGHFQLGPPPELSVTNTHHVHGTLGTLESVPSNLPHFLLDDGFLDPDHVSPQGGDEHLYVCEKTR